MDTHASKVPTAAMFTWLTHFQLWLQALTSSWIQRIIIAVLSAGPIPRHVAFVMDGNRRYAKVRGKQAIWGHSNGYTALRKVLEICFKLKIRCVSVYAFAIDNFKRSPVEVDGLMDLAKEKIRDMCEHSALLEEYGVRLNVIGNKSLLPLDLQKVIAEAENLTRNNNNAIFNLCMPYSSRDEITTAVNSNIQEVLETNAPIESITPESIESHLMITKGGSPPLDILIRTSGVKRLSDFMLWQCCENTQIHFIKTYWPEFGLRDFVPVILEFQRKVWNQQRKERQLRKSRTVYNDDTPSNISTSTSNVYSNGHGIDDKTL